MRQTEPRGIAYHLPDYDVRHVNGEQSSGHRAEIIEAFKDEPNALLTNARCLTEGINIPAVDMVAFIDPRQSRIDITQAVGRAMRKPRGPTTKTVGYVVVPVFAGVGDNDSLEDAIKSEKFGSVVDVLNALQEHDEELVDIIRELKERKGMGEPFNPRRLLERIELIGPRVDLDRLATSISVEIADSIGNSWDEWFGLLTQFRAREGHAAVPRHFLENGLKLGHWVSAQRAIRESMSAERKQRLDQIGFVWDPLESAWEEGFAALTNFKAREGHCRVFQSYVEGTVNLGSWTGRQRQRREAMSARQRQLLDRIGFVWEPLDSAWEEGYAALSIFRAREGHCKVPQRHVEGVNRLGLWVAVQRRSKDALPAERKQRLDESGFVWDPHESAWEEGFAALSEFKAREGHCRAPEGYVEGMFNLGSWVSAQRTNREGMSAERKQRLDQIGFVWDPYERLWEEGFSALTKFKTREGHCNVPKRHSEGNFKLGQWVGERRKRKDAMPIERRQSLDNIGFVWDPIDGAWEEGFAALTKFKAREGHCRVPTSQFEEAFRVGVWVSNQRASRDALSAERKQRLEEIGFIWHSLRNAWEDGFAALTKFKARNGHCRVAPNCVEGTFKLGTWVQRQRASKKQRANRATMAPEREERLNSMILFGIRLRVIGKKASRPLRSSRRAKVIAVYVNSMSKEYSGSAVGWCTAEEKTAPCSPNARSVWKQLVSFGAQVPTQQ